MTLEESIIKIINESDSNEKLILLLEPIIKSKDFLIFSNAFETIKKTINSPASIFNSLKTFLTIIYKINDFSIQVDFLKAILNYIISISTLESFLKEIEPKFIEACEKSERFLDLAKFYDSKHPSNEYDDNVILQSYLKIVSNYIKAGNINIANSKLVSASKHRFPLRTPKELLVEYDLLFSEISINNHSFESAADKLFFLFKTTQDIAYLKRSMIFTVLSNPGPRRSSLLLKIIDEEKSNNLPLFSLVEKMNKRQLINLNDLSTYWKIIEHEKNININDLKTILRMHNLGEISFLYNTVTFKRLSYLIGADESEILRIVEQMIGSNRLNAKIDQPNKILIYNDNQLTLKDNNIKSFCDNVQLLSQQINHL